MLLLDLLEAMRLIRLVVNWTISPVAFYISIVDPMVENCFNEREWMTGKEWIWD